MRSRGIRFVIPAAAVLAIAALPLFLFAFLSGCTGSRSPEHYHVPEWVKDVGKKKKEEPPKPSSVKVNFYYDNTIGMQGFAQDVNYKPSKKTPLEGLLLALRDTIEDYNRTTYTLQKNTDGVAYWSEYTESFFEYYYYSGFYTHNDTKLPKNGNTELGPLTLLVSQNNKQFLDTAALNIILTDLAEQDYNSTELGGFINEKVLSKAGYAAALMPFLLDYNGKPYTNVTGVQSKWIQGARPLYVIMTGPEDSVKSVMQDFNKKLDQHFDKKGTRYEPYVQCAKETAQRVDVNRIKIPSVPSWSEDKRFKKALTDGEDAIDVEKSTFNCNFALKQLNEAEARTLFNNDSILGYFDLNNGRDFNVFQYAGSDEAPTFVLNYYIPIPEETLDNYYMYLPGKIADDDKKPQKKGPKGPQIKENEDAVIYDYVTIGPLKGSASKKKRGAESSSEEYPLGVWNSKDGERRTTPSDFRACFSVTAELIDRDDLTNGKLEGAKLFTKKGKEYHPSSSRDDTESKDDSARNDTESKDDIDLSRYKYWVHLTVKSKQKPAKDSMVAFDLPILAYKAPDKTTPDWVKDLNATRSNADGEQYGLLTYNLTGFFDKLFKVDTPADDEGREKQAVPIAHIITVITNVSESERD